MRIYLVQHGESVAGEINPDRPLTENGRKDINKLAEFLRKNRSPVSKILHSGKTRAQQTAEILGISLLPDGIIEMINGITPKDPVVNFARDIYQLNSNTMIVSHLPFLPKLISCLITGRNDQLIVNYQPGTIVCIEQDEDRTWKIQWMIRPDCF